MLPRFDEPPADFGGSFPVEQQVVGPLQEKVLAFIATEIDERITRGEGTRRLQQAVGRQRAFAVKEDP